MLYTRIRVFLSFCCIEKGLGWKSRLFSLEHLDAAQMTMGGLEQNGLRLFTGSKDRPETSVDS